MKILEFYLSNLTNFYHVHHRVDSPASSGICVAFSICGLYVLYVISSDVQNKFFMIFLVWSD